MNTEAEYHVIVPVTHNSEILIYVDDSGNNRVFFANFNCDNANLIRSSSTSEMLSKMWEHLGSKRTPIAFLNNTDLAFFAGICQRYECEKRLNAEQDRFVVHDFEYD